MLCYTDGVCKYLKGISRVLFYPVLDLYKCSGLQPQVPVIAEKYMPDGLHPKDNVHKILAQLITAFLKNQL